VTAPIVRKPLLRVLAGQREPIPPLWLMRQAGRYLPEYRALREKAAGFLDLCFDAKRAAEITLQPIRRFGFDAAILFSDILVVPHALGQRVSFVEGEGPRLDALNDPAANAVAGEPSEAANEAAWASRLSSRELEVAFLVARGLSNKEVARKLNVTDGTIKVHMHRIFKKLGTMKA